ncbi:cadherin-related tumor suppressor [Aplysia californica]|uniref:Cadherin-related tumor suppressor n=1 Tax=Aplysia californica TaxID=6500 RepID=A0ABM0JFB9_APLCA|nr:cadherin-related tumor suppressor [Aplysia californica]
MTLLSPRRRAMHTAPYMLHHVLCVILLHFLVAFAQGQGPGIIELSVVENSIVGTVVGSVDYVQGYSYSFQEPNSLFELSTSGTLRTLDSIDRESIPESLVRLFVVGTPPTTLDSQVTFSVVITVLDVNDNRPDFQVDDNKEIIAFQEDAREGRTKSIITASDPDGGNNGTLSYRIASGNEKGMFGLDFTGLPLILYLVKRGSEGFDREKLDYYELVVSACDGGVPPLCTELTVGVNILDVNDNTPAFDLSDYTTQVNESAPVGSSVFRAEATDEDIGLNGEVSYRLEDESNQFKIDENTGVIETVTSPLACSRRCGRSSNKCSPNSCFIKIVASDKGLNALSGRAYLYIEVLDENDHNPIISFSKDNADITTASVDESADLQTVVFTVTVTDEDSGANGETSLRIIKGNEEGYFFHLSIPQYDINEIQVQKALDRETINKFNLTFEAVDHGSPQRTSTAHILIYVNDANDHQPVFDRDDYSVSLSEFSKPHSFVANVRATDKDEGVNSKLTYQISSGNEFSWFNIDPDTGLVTTRTYIDHEKSAMVVLNISAHDGGSIPKYSHAVLSITVGDENDCAPKFSKSSYKLELEENIPPAADITTLSAVDLDSAENGTVEFSIHPDTEMQFPNTFQIHPTSGKLTAQKRFDREEKSHYVIKVIAQDKGPQPLSSTATIDLSIKDVNDNPPKFTPKENYVNVFDSDPAGLQVVSVSAHDKDTGENGKILYALRNSINDFEIDKDSGMISTSRQLSAREYRLVVSAVDGGGRPSENDAIIKVIVISISSLAPVFTDSEYNFRIREDEQEKQHQTDRTVGQVQATSQTSQPVTYAIIDGDVESVFKIGASSGVISTLSAIDREVQPQYTLTVIALAGEKIISKKVTVTVEDVNDNSPEFLTHTTEATVLENWPVGHNIFLAQATDSDAGNNRVITYSLASADDTNDVFAIDAQTGVISLAKPPNQLASDSTTLTVTATDGGSSPRSRSMQVVMRLEDVNDHTPLFALTRHELFVSEAQSVNEVVMEVHATDEDEGPNGDLSYSIVRGNEEHRFGIFPEGSLFVAHGLDREKRDMYSLTITVKDNGKEPRSSSVNITVYVQDENDNAPEFTQVSYEFRVRENMPADSYVGSVKAVDNDLGRNAEILYSLGGGNVNFTIDPILGTIFTKREFDREYIVKTTNLPYYVFDVYASDNGLHKQQSKVSVRVNVLDENDSPPVFLQASGSSRAVSENTEVGEEITTLVAVDADAGANAAVTYAITAGNEDGKFRIHETDGKLFLQLALDRESRDHYMLTIKATDTGESVQLESTTDLEIYVLDYNDNAPEFAADTVRSVTVSETTLEGENLAIFSGTDRDMGNNAKLRFDIVSGNEDDTFRLNMATGYLYLARELNYEAKREHVLNITLSDSGFPALSVSLTFKVIVLDANDNAPVFLHGQSRIHIKENRDVGSSIAEVSAKDEDSGELGQVRFSIYKQTPVGDHFQINPVSGVITLSNAFDREVADSFEVTIHATDQVSNPALRRTSEKFLTILVDDVNDNPPVFNSPSVFLVAYPSPSGTTVASLSASDVDDGDNAKVTFNFVGAKPLLFNLNPSTGTISLAQDLPASHLSYTLTVIATDGVRGSSSSTVNTATATVTLLLYTSSGVGPVFLSSNPKSGTVDENMPEGTEVLRMSAQPSKPGLGSVEYYITRVSAAGQDYAEVFTVGRSSGVVSTAAILDREKLPASLQVDINAVEKENGEQRVTTTQVEISIVDKNDNPPVFSSSLYDAEVKEAGQSDSSVARVFVTDPDPTASLSLTLSGPDSGNFRIGQDGVVTAVKPLDYGKQRTYRMSVDASDGKHQVRSSLHLTVVDINDHAPSFDRPFYSFEVLESARPGATIGHVLATDQDNGLNARVTYELQSEWGKEYFLLDEVQGSLTLLKELDYEERQLYTLKVIAKDAGSPPLNSVVTVYVDVKDANDNQPLFDPVSYYREISEDAEILTWLVNVSATDMDSGE